MPPVRDVHDLRKGEIGYVVHTFNKFYLNAWVRWRPPIENKSENDFAEICPNAHGIPLHLHHEQIPHGTPVLIVGGPDEFTTPKTGERRTYYRVLFGELDCWVERQYVINPYVHNEFKDQVIEDAEPGKE